jgi:uncharacterized membrane protein
MNKLVFVDVVALLDQAPAHQWRHISLPLFPSLFIAAADGKRYYFVRRSNKILLAAVMKLGVVVASFLIYGHTRNTRQTHLMLMPQVLRVRQVSLRAKMSQ